MKHLSLPMLLPALALAGITGPAPQLPPIPPPSGSPQAVQVLSSMVPTSSVAYSSSSAYVPTPCNRALTNLAHADSLFALGLWIPAAELYAQRCPCVEKPQRASCILRQARAYSQDPTTLEESLRLLDSMALSAEPEQKGFGELMTTHCSLLLKAGQTARALKAWRLAQQATEPGLETELKALCVQIRTQRKDTVLATDCNKLPPLNKKLTQGISSLALRSSSSIVAAPKVSLSSSSHSVPSSSTKAVSSSSAGSWILQLGAFSNRDNADLLLKNLRSRKIPSRMVTRNTASKVLWLVQTETFPSKEAAQAFGEQTLTPLNLEFQVLKTP